MNTAVTLPELESVSRQPATRPLAAHPLPLWPRVWRQCAHELRRQRLLVLLMWLLPVTSLTLRCAHAKYHFMMLYIIAPASGAFCIALACRCVWASSAARPEMMVHTQPVGRMALILAQGLFMMVAIVIPWVLLDVVAGLGFAFSGIQWCQLVLGSLLVVCLPIGLCAAWMSAARTYRQQGVIFMVTLLLWWLAILLCDSMRRADLLDWLVANSISSEVGFWVHGIGAGLLGLVLWVLQSLLHRRRVMLYTALAGAVILALVTLGWSWDWSRPDPFPYGGGTPKLVVAEQDMKYQPGTTRLWERVVVEGLRPGEAAVIANLLHRGFRFPSGFSDAEDRDRTDPPLTDGSKRIGVNADMVRSIGGSLPADWLMFDDGNLYSRSSFRDALQLTATNLSQVQSRDAWAMDLAIVEPRMVAEFPLRDIIGLGQKEFVLEPGLRVAMGENKGSGVFPVLQLWMVVSDRQPLLSKYPSDRRGHLSNQKVARRLYVLLLDDSRKMAQVEVSPSITLNPSTIDLLGMSFSTRSFTDYMKIAEPQARMQLTGLTREEWISRVRVQIWWPELKGFRTVQLPGTDVQRLAKEQGQ